MRLTVAHHPGESFAERWQMSMWPVLAALAAFAVFFLVAMDGLARLLGQTE